MTLIPRLLLSLLLLFGSPVVLAEAPDQPPRKLLRALERGVNLPIWFTYRDQPGIDPARWHPDAADWQLIDALGLKHVRVQFDPAWFRDAASPSSLQAERLAMLRSALQPAWDEGLVVVLAAEPLAAEKSRLVKDAAGIAELATFWRDFAAALSDVRPNRLVFELLNEPVTPDAASNRALMLTLAEAVRSVAPRHTLVVEGHGYSNIDELLAIEPLPLDNLVYSFHFYEPHNFTHQGTFWGWPLLLEFKGWPYPSSVETVAPLLEAASDTVKPHLRYFGEQGWARDRIAARLDLAREWAAAKNVAIWCGEFGAARLAAPPDARARWLADVRSALEARDIGWTLFDYTGHFGLFTGLAGARQIDGADAEALGLD